MTAMRQSHSRIYLAGHTGLVGGAILRGLRARGYQQVITRTHAQLDLTDQSQTRAFFEQESPEVVIVAAARVGASSPTGSIPGSSSPITWRSN